MGIAGTILKLCGGVLVGALSVLLYDRFVWRGIQDSANVQTIFSGKK
ncbi:MAG: hypothetical protein WA414_04425 [Acidobacteriaceae bacterium]